MGRGLAVTMVLACALLPGAARAGVTIHYGGTVRADADVAAVLELATGYAKAKGWTVERRGPATVLRPHAFSEPVELVFEGRVLAESWVKTQFAGPITHVEVVELFRAIAPRFEALRVEDEGEYWATSDRERLLARMQSDGLMTVRMKEVQAGASGPYRLPDGRIADVLRVEGLAGEAAVRKLRARGVTPLGAPVVPPRPWVPELPRLAPHPADAWRPLDAPADRLRAAFPGSPERTTGGEGVQYRLASGGLVFEVRAAAPFTGKDAARALADFPAAMARRHVGRLLSDEVITVDGHRVRNLSFLEGEEPVSARVVIAGGRAYVLSVKGVRGLPADEDLRRFFGSFQPIGP